MVNDIDLSEESSSNDDSDSSEDLANDRIWTCDDIYPSKNAKSQVSDDDNESSDDDDDDDSSSDESFATPAVKTKPILSSTGAVEDSDEDSSDEEDQDKDKPLKKTAVVVDRRNTITRKHSSREIEMTLSAQSAALQKVVDEEARRRSNLDESKHEFEERNAKALDVSRHIDDEFEALSKEYDSSDDDAIKAIEEKLEAKRNSTDSCNIRSEEKAKFERRNMEREMRLAKARERIEKKKDDEAAKNAQERLLREEGGYGKLDMSKAARVERAYSWYSRMAMPSREKMKERVEFMPASSGVTPDDVDLLPWNARGTFVSVAAMMRINRTASSSGSAAPKKGSDSDSDSD